MRSCLFIFLGSVISYAASANRPNWLKPCSRKDPNFNACALKSAYEAIPILINGDKKLGLPSFNPFRISRIELFGQDTFKLGLKDVKAYGLDKVQPQEFKIDFAKRAVKVKTFVPKIDIMAEYEIDGRVLILPLKGSGPCKLSLVNGTYDYSFIYELETRNGVQYAKINDALSTYDYNVRNVQFHLENLFNGDKRLGDETNKLLNESWSELNKDLKGSVVQTLLSIYSQLAKKIYEKVPYNEIVLP